jgi:hypothetical protein
MLGGLALVKLAIHLVAIGRYGFFRDELYYMACGEHLAWGYIDQPPLVALVAWFGRHVFGNSMIGVRILPIVAGVLVVILTGLLAREMGGGSVAQASAAIAVLFAPLYLAFNSFLSMNAAEPLFWLLCAWIAAKIQKGATPRLWLLFGVIAGIGLENKHTMLVFGFSMVAGLLLSGGFRHFRSRWIWLGGLVALAIFLPNLIWEFTHGWPQIEVVRNAQQFKNSQIGTLEFLRDQVLFMQPVALPAWLGGLGWLLFSREGKPFRFLGWAYLLVMFIFISLDGKSYYPHAFYPILMAAGGVAFERFAEPRSRAVLRFGYPALLVIAGLVTAPFGTPLLPLPMFVEYASAFPYDRHVQAESDTAGKLPQLYEDMQGWENVSSTIARVYWSLPSEERAGCAILAGNYGEAGAIDYFGPRLGLPKAISGHNNYYLWGPRGYPGECVILFGERAGEYAKYFGDVERKADIVDSFATPSEQHVEVYVCRKPVAPLAELWPHFKMII